MVMRKVAIKEIKMSAAGSLVVVPDLRPGEDFAFIYRAAMEVTWDEAARALSSPLPRPGGWSHVEWFRQILRAAADEYGTALLIDSGTKWSVPADVRGSIEGVVAG
jgi:hypothetical protein